MGRTRKEAQEKIILTLPRGDDHRHCVELRNANAGYFFSPGRVTLASHLAWYDLVARDETRLFYVVKLGRDVIGTIGLSSIDYYHEHAEYGQFVIGEEWRGRGYGRRALAAVARLAFGEFGLRRVWGDILTQNLRGIQTAHSVGFVLEGHFKGHIRQGDEFVDVVRVALSRSVFDGVS